MIRFRIGTLFVTLELENRQQNQNGLKGVEPIESKP
jgi:hypothetical protein